MQKLMSPIEAKRPGYSVLEDQRTFVDDKTTGDNSHPQPLRTNTVQRTLLASLFYEWRLDILGVIVSSLTFVAIGGILAHFDNQPQPRWDLVSLNTVISWLSQVAKFAILGPISTSLGQLKWVWFSEKERQLSDLESFETASRGIAGGLGLIWRLKGQHITTLGALAVTLALAFDPFVQNSIQFSPKLLSDPNQIAQVANNSVYDAVQNGTRTAGEYVDPSLKSAIYNGLVDTDKTQLWAKPQYSCPSGNCTWPAVTSIGIHSLCSDISDQLTPINCTDVDGANFKNCTTSLGPNLGAYYFTNGANSIPMTMTTTLNVTRNNNFENFIYKNTSLAVIQSLWAADNPGGNFSNITYKATECALFPCVQTFNGNVTRGNYNEDLVDQWLGPVNYDSTGQRQNVYEIQPSLDGTTYGISSVSYYASQKFLKFAFQGRVESDSDGTNQDVSFYDTPTGYDSATTSNIIQALYFSEFAETDCDNPDDKLACGIMNVAKAMSKAFRDAPFVANGVDGSNMTSGETFVPISFVHITWGWFALPVAVWMLGTLTFIGAVWQTRKSGTQPWGNKILPVVFMGVENEDMAKGESSGISREDFEKRADNLKVRLRVVDDQVKLVSNPHSASTYVH